jgi:hypothetical protein
MNRTKRPAWYKQAEGSYRNGQWTIRRGPTPDGKWSWACYFNGRLIDVAPTLVEAKRLCS